MRELLDAIENDSLVKIRQILQTDIDLTQGVIIGEEYDLEDPDEISLLFYAIRTHASIEAIELLLDAGVEIVQYDDDHVSTLDIAIKFKRYDVAQRCLDAGIVLNETKRKSGMLPLLLAACFGDEKMVSLLLQYGASLEATDRSGMNAIAYAQKLGQKKMVTFLEAYSSKNA